MRRFFSVAAVAALIAWSLLAFVAVFAGGDLNGAKFLITVSGALTLGLLTALSIHVVDRLP